MKFKPIIERAKNPFRPRSKKWVDVYRMPSDDQIRGLGKRVEGMSHHQEEMAHSAAIELAKIQEKKVVSQTKTGEKLARFNAWSHRLTMRHSEAQARHAKAEEQADEWEGAHPEELGRNINRWVRIIALIVMIVGESFSIYLAMQVLNATQNETIVLAVGLSLAIIMATHYVSHKLALGIEQTKHSGFASVFISVVIMGSIFGILAAGALMRKNFFEIVAGGGVESMSAPVLFTIGLAPVIGAFTLELLWHNSVASEADRRNALRKRYRSILVIWDIFYVFVDSRQDKYTWQLDASEALAQTKMAQRIAVAHQEQVQLSIASPEVHGITGADVRYLDTILISTSDIDPAEVKYRDLETKPKKKAEEPSGPPKTKTKRAVTKGRRPKKTHDHPEKPDSSD